MEDQKRYKEKLKWKLNFGEKRVKSFGGKSNKETLVLVGNICLESFGGNQCHDKMELQYCSAPNK